MHSILQSKLPIASALAIVTSLSLSAAAQDAAATEAASAGTTAPDTSVAPPPPQTGAAEPSPSMAATSTPVMSINAQEDARADVVEHSWPNRPMLITGLVVLGGSYGASAIVGAVSDREADEKLFYPVVGPWLDLKERDCEVNDCGDDTFNKVLLVGDGVLQGIGALTTVLSLVIPESTKKPWYLIGSDKLSVAPRVGSSMTGLSASGKF